MPLRRASVRGIVLLSTLLAAGRSAAQDVPDLRLTVRPREMATGTRTEKAGMFGVPGGGVLYVPPKCVGTQRCPLMVTFPEFSLDSMVRYWRRGVDEFGMLLLVSLSEDGPDVNMLDTELKHVLAEFAVDPDRIAIKYPKFVFANPDVFNRAFTYEGPVGTTDHPAGPRVGNEEIFEDAGVTNEYGAALTTFTEMAALRAQGYPTKQWLGLRAHSFDDYHGYGPQASFYFAARWLHQSWSIPDPAARPAPAVIADPLPLLTPQAMTQMIAFWESFLQEPDSIRGAVRQKHLREVAVPLGLAEGTPSTGMVDMTALAAESPSVAAKLKAAGLTPRQHDAYRVALWSAIFLAAARNPAISQAVRVHPSLLAVDGNSVLEKNVAFILAHPDELLALEQTAIWMTP